jgi:hypothetical protein
MMAHLAQDKDGKFYLADDWHIEDVQSVRPDLNDDQAADVLEAVADNHDANYGINWDVLRYWADELYPAEEDEQDEED